MKQKPAFLISGKFFINLGLILLIIFLVFFGVIKWLATFTEHGQYVIVPDFKGKRIPDLDNYAGTSNVSWQIVDSIYDPAEQAGIVLRQDPGAGSKVKHNRKVYLYVTGMVPPQVSMPKLTDMSERQARIIIGSYGLKVGRVYEKEADCNGCVIMQMIKGREIEPGQGIKKGSVVDLVIGIKDSYLSRRDTVGLPDEDEFE